MVDGDDLQGKRLVEDGEGGFLEGGQAVVDRQGVVGIVRVAADIGDDGEFSLVLTLLYQGQGEERRGLGCFRVEINTVDEYVVVQYLFKGSPFRSLRHIPLDHLQTQTKKKKYNYYSSERIMSIKSVSPPFSNLGRPASRLAQGTDDHH